MPEKPHYRYPYRAIERTKMQPLSRPATSEDLEIRNCSSTIPFNPDREAFLEIARKSGELVSEKNAAYGKSFHRSGEFLKLLYPDGIRPEQYQDALALVRVFDKQMRIATAKDAFGESPWADITGYGILGVHYSEQGRQLDRPEVRH